MQRLRALNHRLLGLDPSKARELVARPGELPLGVVARVEGRALRRFRERDPALEMGDEMGNAVRAHDRERRIKPALPQRRDFVERPLRKHGVEPRVDASAEFRAIGREIKARPFAFV